MHVGYMYGILYLPYIFQIHHESQPHVGKLSHTRITEEWELRIIIVIPKLTKTDAKISFKWVVTPNAHWRSLPLRYLF